MALKTGTEPGGMRKEGPSLRSMRMAWEMKKVESWAKEMERAMVEAHTGSTRRKDLNSSTWVTVHSLQRLVVWWSSRSAITAALSKNLHLEEPDGTVRPHYTYKKENLRL